MEGQIKPHRGIASRPIPSDIEPNIALTDAERLEIYRRNVILEPFARDLARKVRAAQSAYRRELMLSFARSVASIFGYSENGGGERDLSRAGDSQQAAPSVQTERARGR
jgi:hypothetical protein